MYVINQLSCYLRADIGNSKSWFHSYDTLSMIWNIHISKALQHSRSYIIIIHYLWSGTFRLQTSSTFSSFFIITIKKLFMSQTLIINNFQLVAICVKIGPTCLYKYLILFSVKHFYLILDVSQ